MLRGIGFNSPSRSRERPRVRARFGLVSASMAQTGRPRPATIRARSPAIVVLPLPPLPATAILVISIPSRVPVDAVRRIPGLVTVAVRVAALAVPRPGEFGELVGKPPATLTGTRLRQHVPRGVVRATFPPHQ